MAKRDELVDFLFEIGQLKRTPRSGWTHAGIKNPESVAEHSHRAAIVAYLLAKETGANPERCATMTLFHEIVETRVGDLNKIEKKYIKQKDVEAKALRDWKRDYRKFGSVAKLFEEFDRQETLDAKTAKDAELIEMIVQLKEYEPQMKKYAVRQWIKNTRVRLLTKEGKRLFDKVIKSDGFWWKRALYKKR